MYPAPTDDVVVRVRAVALGGACGEEIVGTVEHSRDLELGSRVALHAPGWLTSPGASAAVASPPGVVLAGPTTSSPPPSVTEDTDASHAPGTMAGPSRTGAAPGVLRVTVPRSAVTPVIAVLPWHLLAAVSGPVRTAHACLAAVGAGPGESVFVREADSPLGATVCVLARRRGLRVVAATRDARQVAALTGLGLDDVLLDDSHLAPRVRELLPNGADAGVEATPVPTDADTQAALAEGAPLWTSEEAPSLVAAPLPEHVLRTFLEDVPAGRAPVFVDSVLPLAEVVTARRRLASGRARGAVVLVAREADLPEPGRLGIVPNPLDLRG